MDIAQGEYFVSGDPETVISTVLGSCVSVCLLDPVSGMAAMNHFVLAIAPAECVGLDPRYGSHSMALMFDELLRHGAVASRLQAKVYGGASLLSAFVDIGERNVDTALSFLRARRIPVFGGCVGGSVARRIDFLPAEGRITLKRFPETPDNDEMPVPKSRVNQGRGLAVA